MEAKPRAIQRYIDPGGNIPFDDWLNSLRDIVARAKIDARLKRVALGNLGDYRSLGGGVYELRINYGPGYRIYFGQIDTIIILLLCGGDKSSQQQDIQTAKQYWTDYGSQNDA